MKIVNIYHGSLENVLIKFITRFINYLNSSFIDYLNIIHIHKYLINTSLYNN